MRNRVLPITAALVLTLWTQSVDAQSTPDSERFGDWTVEHTEESILVATEITEFRFAFMLRGESVYVLLYERSGDCQHKQDYPATVVFGESARRTAARCAALPHLRPFVVYSFALAPFTDAIDKASEFIVAIPDMNIARRVSTEGVGAAISHALDMAESDTNKDGQ